MPTCSSWRRWRCCCSPSPNGASPGARDRRARHPLLVARLASAWGLSHSLELGSARKAGAGLTALVIVACSALVLYRMILML
jgi:hypothetical protein